MRPILFTSNPKSEGGVPPELDCAIATDERPNGAVFQAVRNFEEPFRISRFRSVAIRPIDAQPFLLEPYRTG